MIKYEIKNKNFWVTVDRDINNNFDDISDLIDIQYEFLHSNCKIIYFYFTKCEYFNAAVVVIVGTLPEYAILHKKFVRYRFNEKYNEKHPILSFMEEVGVYEYFDKKTNISYTGKNAIPFNKIENEEMMDKYTDMIMELAPIKMEHEAQCILSSYIYEIYQNGLFHSESKIGVFTSGLWSADKKEFNFSIYDMGIGIPNKVREYLDKNEDIRAKYIDVKGEISSEKCLKIAFVEGFTTSDDNLLSRGLGLSSLEKFIRLNAGSMLMFTDDICCIINKQEERKYVVLEKPIKGTLIIISIIADENHIYVVE